MRLVLLTFKFDFEVSVAMLTTNSVPFLLDNSQFITFIIFITFWQIVVVVIFQSFWNPSFSFIARIFWCKRSLFLSGVPLLSTCTSMLSIARFEFHWGDGVGSSVGEFVGFMGNVSSEEVGDNVYLAQGGDVGVSSGASTGEADLNNISPFPL